jgi:hypothetical protein
MAEEAVQPIGRIAKYEALSVPPTEFTLAPTVVSLGLCVIATNPIIETRSEVLLRILI